MSTHAFIGLVTDGEISYTYLHYDGYVHHVGNMLLNYYKTQETVTNLIELGDLDVLAPMTQECVALENGYAPRTVHFTEFPTHELAYLFHQGTWFYRERNGNFAKLQDAVVKSNDPKEIIRKRLALRIPYTGDKNLVAAGPIIKTKLGTSRISITMTKDQIIVRNDIFFNLPDTITDLADAVQASADAGNVYSTDVRYFLFEDLEFAIKDFASRLKNYYETRSQ